MATPFHVVHQTDTKSARGVALRSGIHPQCLFEYAGLIAKRRTVQHLRSYFLNYLIGIGRDCPYRARRNQVGVGLSHIKRNGYAFFITLEWFRPMPDIRWEADQQARFRG